jgi:hypothetical protein
LICNPNKIIEDYVAAGHFKQIKLREDALIAILNNIVENAEVGIFQDEQGNEWVDYSPKQKDYRVNIPKVEYILQKE